MGGPPSGPLTESDLLQSLPPSNRTGTFPRDLLSPGERILFETRPNLFGLYWGRLTALFLVDLLWLWLCIGLPANPVGWFLFGLFTLLILYYIFVWRATAYALTDRRVLRVAGLRQSDFMEALYDQVQNLRLEPGLTGGIKFDATPPNGPFGLLGGRKYAKTVYWQALPQSARVYEFVQSSFALHALRNAQEAQREILVSRINKDRLPCKYCGTLVDFRRLSSTHPKCPSCGAPFAPLGVG